jgi:hypothetical protein
MVAGSRRSLLTPEFCRLWLDLALPVRFPVRRSSPMGPDRYPDAKTSIFPEDESASRGASECLSGRDTLNRPIAGKRSVLRRCGTVGILGIVTFLFCQCHRQPQMPAPTPTPTPAPIASPSPSADPTVTPTPTAVPEASISPLPSPSVSPTPDAFEEGIKQLLQASENGFRELHGKFKRTENGSGAVPLFRVRKIYEGNFLFEGAASAELEEVYYTAGRQPAYNYHLYFQALSPQASIGKYDDLRLNLNRVLKGFEHTFGDRYDAWARDDPLKTAILLSSQDVAGSLEIQVHVGFKSPQW